MTPEELRAIRDRANNATPGPWIRHILYGDICGPNGEELFYGADDGGTVWAHELDDAIFATHARTDIPDLLDHVDTLTAQLAEKDKALKLIRDTLRDLRNETVAERDRLAARLAAVRHLVNNPQTVGWVERDGDTAWVPAAAVRAALDGP